jgi:hypothetical protein
MRDAGSVQGHDRKTLFFGNLFIVAAGRRVLLAASAMVVMARFMRGFSARLERAGG